MMNLFCFSLEGSMDNLYEPVQNIQESTENNRNRASTPPRTFTKIVSYERSLSMEKDKAECPISPLTLQEAELPDLDTTDSKKKRKKSHIQTSVSENDAFDRRAWSATHWRNSRKPDNDSWLRKHGHVEDLSEEDYMMGEGANLLSRKSEDNPCQVPSYEQWSLPHNQSSNPNGSATEMELDDNKSESMGTLKRLQKIVRTKKAQDDIRHSLLQSPTQNIDEEEEETLITCMKLTKSQEKKPVKEMTRKRQDVGQSMELNCSSLDRSRNLKRNTSRGVATCPDNPPNFLMDWKAFPDNFEPFLFSPSQPEDWEHCVCCNHHIQLPSSLTDMDIPYSWRNSSFGAFERFKKPSVSKPEDLNEMSETESIFEGGGGASDGDKTSHSSLTKKMKAISLTMRKKMGKKYIKALSEHEDGDGCCSSLETDPTGAMATEGVALRASDSVESLYSLNSGQSSSSGVTSCSDGTSNRDSMRFDDDVPYTGPFCGRARVHTDFTPSPYDTESLKIKKGEIIDIICKTPMGIWTGMLNNKVGNFKFIYVDVISEEEAPVVRKLVRRRSKRPRPKTLQELLERFNLQDYMSSLLLNGYETLEDLKYIKESHLCELNITDPEERMRLLVAIENLQDCTHGQEQENETSPLTLGADLSPNKCELSDCPRDSGCYITLENSENSKDHVDESGKRCEAVQKITVTQSP